MLSDSLSFLVFGRKRMPPDLQPAWEVFQQQAERVEAARQTLLGCLPVGRVDPAPVPVGLDVLDDELAAVAAEMDRWRRPEVADHWQACHDATKEARDAVTDARRVAATSEELEDLLEAISDVVEPLDAWADAERAWLRLRTRSR